MTATYEIKLRPKKKSFTCPNGRVMRANIPIVLPEGHHELEYFRGKLAWFTITKKATAKKTRPPQRAARRPPTKARREEPPPPDDEGEESEDEDAGPTSSQLRKMKKDELLEYAAELGIEVDVDSNKRKLIELIEASED